MTPGIRISRTIGAVATAWEEAEAAVRAEIGESVPGTGEEFITERFHGKFAETLRQTSRKGRIERAFSADLSMAAPNLSELEIGRTARGLVADVSLHPREVEKKTGGDLGLVIIRPTLARSARGGIQVGRGYRRGILCQAKLKAIRGRWNSLTKNETKVLQGRLDYLVLLLYRYGDRRGRELNEFRWQLCRGVSIDDVKAWLREDEFPSIVASRKILVSLGNGEIGTDNEQILENVISPAGTRVLVIKIDWPSGGGPRQGLVIMESKQESLERQRVLA
jgi:hypothetical protein